MTKDRSDGGRVRAGRGSRPNGDGMRERIVRAVERYHEQHDRWPTYRDIGAAIRVESTSHIAHHVAILVKQGILTHQPGISRGIALARADDAPPPAASTHVLVRGRIAAGEPLDLFDSGEVEELDLGLAGLGITVGPRSDDVYALRVKGDSMIEDGIRDSDYVFIQPGETAPNGAIAVVVERRANGGQGAATLKHILKLEESVRLQPANPAHPVREVSRLDWDREWEVQGTAVGVYRRLGR